MRVVDSQSILYTYVPIREETIITQPFYLYHEAKTPSVGAALGTQNTVTPTKVKPPDNITRNTVV